MPDVVAMTKEGIVHELAALLGGPLKLWRYWVDLRLTPLLRGMEIRLIERLCDKDRPSEEEEDYPEDYPLPLEGDPCDSRLCNGTFSCADCKEQYNCAVGERWPNPPEKSASANQLPPPGDRTPLYDAFD